MPKITFIFKNVAGFQRLEVDAAPGSSILAVALDHEIEIEHACGGACACASCHVFVQAGGASLSPQSEREEDLLDQAWGVSLQSRLSCQAVVGEEDLTVEIPASLHLLQPSLGWEDREQIAEALEARYAEHQPESVRFTDLYAWILALPGFTGDKAEVSEARLEAVLSAWLDLRA